MTYSDYMHFAKTGASARYNLASSGVADCTLEELALEPDSLALHGQNAYGYPPLISHIAGRFNVDPTCVVTPGGGTSFANHLALAAILAPGDHVLIEQPTYALITDTLAYLHADVRFFLRSPHARWQIDPENVIRSITPRTRLVILTNLHNPSGDLTDADTIDLIAGAAERVGALLLVDEVYRELLFADGRATTSFRPDGNIVVTSSLTKAYGLSGLRCGWCLAPPHLAERMRRLNDLFGVLPSHPAECMAVAAFERLSVFRARATKLISANRNAYAEILADHPALEQSICQQGTTMFPRLRMGDGDALYERLMSRFETSVAPGRFFGCPAHVRIGLGGDVQKSREGMARLADALC